MWEAVSYGKTHRSSNFTGHIRQTCWWHPNVLPQTHPLLSSKPTSSPAWRLMYPTDMTCPLLPTHGTCSSSCFVTQWRAPPLTQAPGQSLGIPLLTFSSPSLLIIIIDHKSFFILHTWHLSSLPVSSFSLPLKLLEAMSSLPESLQEPHNWSSCFQLVSSELPKHSLFSKMQIRSSPRLSTFQ